LKKTRPSKFWLQTGEDLAKSGYYKAKYESDLKKKTHPSKFWLQT
jgi:hypothetical protein